MYILFSLFERGIFMKFQWTWLIGLLFAIIIAVFSVLNVDTVPVNYAFGTQNGHSYWLYYVQLY